MLVHDACRFVIAILRCVKVRAYSCPMTGDTVSKKIVDAVQATDSHTTDPSAGPDEALIPSPQVVHRL